ncbi:unnamed protein product [Polarella glacialis]|uniref:Uncharacterized protein n=1 Tax=Polarella glacialis TaxID=89957 RepID=A0A813KLI5_POLGL|nr:unnamed protein product [Polarella glacialis]
MIEAGDLPLHHLMIETDCPFMLPDKQYLPDSLGIQDRKNEPVLYACCASSCSRVSSSGSGATQQGITRTEAGSNKPVRTDGIRSH